MASFNAVQKDMSHLKADILRPFKNEIGCEIVNLLLIGIDLLLASWLVAAIAICVDHVNSARSSTYEDVSLYRPQVVLRPLREEHRGVLCSDRSTDVNVASHMPMTC